MCKCAPCLLELRAELDAAFPGVHPNLGCCGDEAHRARVSDHNPATAPPEAAGYAHAHDFGEGEDHGLQWLVDRVMGYPGAYPQVAYLIYERRIYYPHDGVRKRGAYPYDGPNAHSTHLHVSIFKTYTHDRRSWYLLGPDRSEMSMADVQVLADLLKAVLAELKALRKEQGAGGDARLVELRRIAPKS
jgi:hypothetical protein